MYALALGRSPHTHPNAIRTVHVSFFFQAEDGIRDVAVTGVQTCALPISLRLIRRILGGIGIGFARFVGLLGSSRSRGVGRLRRGPLLRILGVAEGRHLENAQSREPRKESLASHKSQ